MTASKPGNSGNLNKAINNLNKSNVQIQVYNQKRKDHLKNLLSKSFRALSKNIPPAPYQNTKFIPNIDKL